MTEVSVSFIDRLLKDAYRIVEYSRGNRAIADQKLWAAIAAVEELPLADRKVQNGKVTELQDAVRECTANIEPQTLLALRTDWDPFKNSWRKKARIGFLVLVSLASMAIVGQLTQIYNSGRLISGDLVALQKGNTLQRFGLLERELNEAQRRLSDGEGLRGGAGDGNTTADAVDADSQADPPAGDARERYLLAREAAYSKQDELIKLDQQIRSLETRALAFQTLARNPIVGMETARAIGGKISSWFACLLNDPEAGKVLAKAAKDNKSAVVDGGEGADKTAREAAVEPAIATCQPGLVQAAAGAGGNADGGGPQGNGGAAAAGQSNGGGPSSPSAFGFYGHEPRSVGMRGIFCANLDYLSADRRASPAVSGNATARYIADIGYTIDNQFGVRVADIISQNCRIGLYYYSGSIPDMASLEARVRDANTLYSFIILPAVYGALGALMFYMRRILDPLLPDPTLLRTVHRVALGALAGVLLAWLWVGIFDDDEDFKAVGLGLFALAFVFGFSIEVFFDFLDRLVSSAKRAVGKIGEPEKGEGERSAG